MVQRCIRQFGVHSLLLVAAFCAPSANAQTILSNAGGTYSNATTIVQHTVGEAIVGTVQSSSVQLTQGFEQPTQVHVRINVKALLEGPYDPVTDLMRDDLRATYVPLTEPYTSLGYVHVNGGGETTTSTVLAFDLGTKVVVDWVFLELREENDPTNVIATRSALILRDGSIVDVDRISAVKFDAPSDDYHIAVHHRNHLSVMTTAFSLSPNDQLIELMDGSTPTFGTESMKLVGSRYAFWAGDVSNDGVIQYTGSSNDRDPILVEIGGSVPTNTTNGYLQEDVNMDGTAKYTGPGNDRDPILVNIGGSVPTNTRIEQLP